MKKINSIEVRRKVSLGNYETMDVGFVISIDDEEKGNYTEILTDTAIEIYNVIFQLRKKSLKWIDEGHSIAEIKEILEKEKQKTLED